MFEKLLAFLKGKVLVSVRGLSPERFLNLCAGRGLELYDLYRDEDGYICEMSLPDYRESRELARKCHVLLHIMSKSGIPFILHRNRKRKAWGIGLFLGIMLLYFMSLFLWDIQIEGNSYYTDDTLLTFLEEQNIVHGMMMSEIVCDELEQAIRNRYTNITWVSAQISGTRLILSLKENFGLMVIPEEENQAYDLIASSDGVITSLVTRSGIPQVKAGDTVTKGQVLVSGRIPILNDAGEITGYSEVAADATIRARTVVPYSWQRSIFIEEYNIVSDGPVGFSLSWNSSNIILESNEDTQPMHYRVTEYGEPYIFNNFTLPFSWTLTTDYTYETLVRRMNEAEQQAAMEEELDFYIANLKEQDIRLLDRDLKLEEGDFTLNVTGTLILDVPFGENSPIVSEEDEPIANENIITGETDG